MRIEDLLPGTKVKCTSATWGRGITEMADLIGSTVTVKLAREVGVILDEAPNLIWSPDDFEPITCLTEPTEEEFMSILFGSVMI